MGVKAEGNFDLILCGKQTTDGDTAQVGPEMAEQLGIVSISNVLTLTPKKGTIEVTMDMGDSILTADVKMPCLISVDKDICQPRLPSYIKKKETEDREVKVLTFTDLKDADKTRCGLLGSPTQVNKIFPPEKNDSREMWNGTADELADRMFKELLKEKFV